MTIATLILTCTIFVALGWTGDALRAGRALRRRRRLHRGRATPAATSQDLKTGLPRRRDADLSADRPDHRRHHLVARHRHDDALPAHSVMTIGSQALPAPQATLMATIIKGLLSQNLPWGLVLVGVFISITLELCGIHSLSFAVGSYLPIATTAPIFAGGLVRCVRRDARPARAEESEVGSGTLFSSGLIARLAGENSLCARSCLGRNLIEEAERDRPHSLPPRGAPGMIFRVAAVPGARRHPRQGGAKKVM